MALTAVKFTSGAAAVLTSNMHTITIKAYLTNTEPVISQTVIDLVTNHPAPAAANGYAPADIQNTVSGNKVLAVDQTFTATAGGIGPFRYIILADGDNGNLFQYYDIGSEITLANAGDNYVLDIDGTNGIITI
jgi:hypothetical protein